MSLWHMNISKRKWDQSEHKKRITRQYENQFILFQPDLKYILSFIPLLAKRLDR